MNRGGGDYAALILATTGFAIGMALARYAFGDVFSPGIWVGLGIGWAVGLALVYYFRRRS